MKVEKLFTGATIVTHGGRYEGNIGVNEGKIAYIGKESIEADEVVAMPGKYLLPGVIDAHIHFQDPGPTDREDMEHGTASCAAGGITTGLSHPMNVPPTTTVENFETIRKAYEGRCYIDYGIHGGGVSTNLKDVDDLWRNTGSTSIKMFMCFSVTDFPFVQDDALYQHLEIIAKNGGLAMIHAENDLILKVREEQLKAEGKNDGVAYNASHPAFAEIEAINRAIVFSEQTGATVLIVHNSTAEGLRMIKEARLRGLKIYAETCPHFLTFTVDDMNKHGPYLKFSPPMHEEENRKELWKLLADGFVDTIGSDHCPYTDDEKKKGLDVIWNAPNGIPGLETMVPVLLDGVNKGLLSLEKVVEVTSYNPGQIYGLAPKKGMIQVGSDADFTIVDMDLEKTYKKEDIKSKCPWSPYVGITFKGWPVMTVVRGAIVYRDGMVVGKLGYGEYVARPK